MTKKEIISRLAEQYVCTNEDVERFYIAKTAAVLGLDISKLNASIEQVSNNRKKWGLD